jgi:hypothetical protein
MLHRNRTPFLIGLLVEAACAVRAIQFYRARPLG